ncbi:MAG: response regulator [Lachnospiraceae bacterium]|nr:response regulator [Lachnospiraceae bacterium]
MNEYGETLKVMIADDEERICQLIEALIDCDALRMEVVGVAHNGLEACELVERLTPDILITDIRMPGYSGLELIEKVKESEENLEIIIISGYAHFAYAQTAIKFGVGDYLLKPINKEELTGTLQKLGERIRDGRRQAEDRRRIQQKSEADIRLFRTNLLNRLTEEPSWKPSLEELREKYYLHVEEGIFQGFLIKVDCDGEIGRAGIDLILGKVQSILENSFRSRCRELVAGIKGTGCIGFLNYESEKTEEIRRIFRDCLNQLESEKGIFGPVMFTAALGNAAKDAGGLTESVGQAALIIEDRLLKGTGKLLERVPAASAIHEQNILEKYVRQIVHAIEVMSVEEAEEAAAQMRQTILEVRDVRGFEVRELIYSAARLFLSQVDVKNRAEAFKEFEQRCSVCGSMDELLARLTALQTEYVEEMCQKREADTVRPIRMAKQYIQNHYSEPITQEEVSGAVGLSAAYFSVLFKKVEGEGFAKYLIGVRMEQAKILLRETNIPVSKICQQVGYNDLKHFTHTFEKTTGVKPTVYRKMYG